MATLQLYSATKSFGKKEILKKVSFICKTGDILGIFGRNGSGKSTLLQMIFGIESANEIKLYLDDHSISPSRVIADKRIAYLPQHPFLPQHARVRDIIPMYFTSEEKQDSIFYDPVIAKIAARKVNELSIGEMKYFEVILMGNLNHDFLMLDEPFSMVEPLEKEALKKFLLQKKKEKGIIITDHYYYDVLDISTKNLVIKDGIAHVVESEEDLRKFDYLSKR